MLSMTGFGKGEAVFKGDSRFVAEISAVNRKQLEIRLALPPEFASFETAARKLISEAVSRGAVQLRVTFSGAGAAASPVNRPLLEALVQESIEVRRKFGLPADVEVEVLLRVPGVVGGVAPDLEDPEVLSAFEQAVRSALEEFRRMRAAEGEALKQDFLARLKELERLLGEIEPLVDGLDRVIRQRLLDKLSAADLPVAVDDERLLKEVLFYADRSDVTEEITRLHSHFGQFRRFLDSDKPVGRSLDFLMQEFFREITTLANKAGVPEVSPLAVAFKSELEKLREQIQNVE